MISPYEGKPGSQWRAITEELLRTFPLAKSDMIDATLSAWDDIFHSDIGRERFKIGVDIFPSPQIMGFFLHELIPLKIRAKHPEWTKDLDVSDKDLLYKPDLAFSMEIKTSSHPNKIFGNRSYAQPAQNPKKDKSGYYLAVNFEGFGKGRIKKPRILLIRFGWLDYTDWVGQVAPTGQQAHVKLESENNKLIELYNASQNSVALDVFGK